MSLKNLAKIIKNEHKEANNLEFFLGIKVLQLGVSCAFMDKRGRILR